MAFLVTQADCAITIYCRLDLNILIAASLFRFVTRSFTNRYVRAASLVPRAFTRLVVNCISMVSTRNSAATELCITERHTVEKVNNHGCGYYKGLFIFGRRLARNITCGAKELGRKDPTVHVTSPRFCTVGRAEQHRRCFVDILSSRNNVDVLNAC